MTSVSKSGAVMHRRESHLNVRQYFSLATTSSSEGGVSGSELKSSGNVDSSTTLEFFLAIAMRTSKTSSLQNNQSQKMK